MSGGKSTAQLHRSTAVPVRHGEFFDPSTEDGKDQLKRLSVSEIFAVMRQWVPNTQRNMNALVMEILNRGHNVNDRDELSDMTLLHFACKAAADGVGNGESALALVTHLIKKGADVSARSCRTSMQPLHYAAVYDCPQVIAKLLKSGKCDVDSPCRDFDNGTALHLAAANVSVQAVQCLLQHKAHPEVFDDKFRLPIDCIPKENDELLSVVQSAGREDVVTSIRQLLQNASTNFYKRKPNSTAHKFKLGAKVVYKTNSAIILYRGEVKFGPAQLDFIGDDHQLNWVGVELNKAGGNCDGSWDGKRYFTCKPNYGRFFPISCPYLHLDTGHSSRQQHSSVNVVTATAPLVVAPDGPACTTAESQSRQMTPVKNLPQNDPKDKREPKDRSGEMDAQERHPHLQVGELVTVSGRKSGVLQYIGRTDFASGVWYGVALDKAEGKNDGSVGGKRYFTCKPLHGVFASSLKIERRLPNGDNTSTSSHSLMTPPTPAKTPVRKLSGGQKNSPMKASHSYSGGVVVEKGEFSHLKLTKGCQVLTAGELAIVRFIGHTEFADGVWIGVELRKPNGKNDGLILGKRYFSCKPNHGLMVRPSRVTFRGINASKLELVSDLVDLLSSQDDAA